MDCEKPLMFLSALNIASYLIKRDFYSDEEIEILFQNLIVVLDLAF